MDESYYVSHGGKIPVKWTAPEVCFKVFICMCITSYFVPQMHEGTAIQEIYHCQ